MVLLLCVGCRLVQLLLVRASLTLTTAHLIFIGLNVRNIVSWRPGFAPTGNLRRQFGITLFAAVLVVGIDQTLGLVPWSLWSIAPLMWYCTRFNWRLVERIRLIMQLLLLWTFSCARQRLNILVFFLRWFHLQWNVELGWDSKNSI